METRRQIETIRRIEGFVRQYRQNNSFLRIKCKNSAAEYLVRLSDIVEIEKRDDFVAIKTSIGGLYPIPKEEYDNKVSKFISVI